MTHAIMVNANDRRQFLELWKKYQSRLPTFGLSVSVDPPMHGPDGNNIVTFYDVPAEFLPVLEAARLSYQSAA